ncbi:MAG TPA: response regulator transcription factor [Opitutaceae bacterium]|nr:response regulator transcription factor [Opitutaceae bacterium]
MPIRIFIVEDHSIVRAGIVALLGAKYDIVGEAADCATAWTRISELRPEVVIADLDVPGEGGISLTRRLKEAMPELRVIVITGSLDPANPRRALQAGASGYLQKTNCAPQLAAAVEGVLRGQTYLCSDTAAVLVREGVGLPARTTLPPRELEVLQWVVRGLRNKEIAEKLQINVKTVETYRARVMTRLGCSSPAELVRRALREGLVES